jgi:anti-sigma B factor antagonist
MAESAVTTNEPNDDALIIRVLVDRLEEDNIQRLQADVAGTALESPHSAIILDLAKVDFMPSLSLAALVRLVTEFRARDQRLLLAGLQPQVREIFIMTHLDRLFELHPDIDAALRSVRMG